MADYSSNAKSLIYGLSDFWLQYFQDTEFLKAYYQGAEVQLGQVYLDLMGLVLNSSLADTPVFNKEYFRLLRIREDALAYRDGTGYVYIPAGDLVDTKYLNNKVLEATTSLERDVDYDVDTAAREFAFGFDPTNAYYERTWGQNNGAIRVRARVRGALGGQIRVWLNDTGAPAPTVIRTQYDLEIQYSTSTSTAAQLVSLLNTKAETRDLVIAEIAGLGTGTASVPGTGGFEALLRAAVNPLEGLATRRYETQLGGKLTAYGRDWVASGVEKGDTLRVLGAPEYGTPQEHLITLVRSDALYTTTIPATKDFAGTVDYVVLRKPEDDLSQNELIADSCQVIQSGLNATLTAVNRHMTAPTLAVNPAFEDEIIEVLGTLNAGQYRISEVVSATEVALAGPPLQNETPVAWALYSTIDAVNTGVNGSLQVVAGQSTALFQAVGATFTPDAVGTLLRVHVNGVRQHYKIVDASTPCIIEVELPEAAATTATYPGCPWAWLRYVAPYTQVLFSPGTYWMKSGTAQISARRAIDNALVVEGTDYQVLYDTGRIKPLTVWRTARDNTVTYNYWNVVTAPQLVASAADGSLTNTDPGTFSTGLTPFTTGQHGFALVIGNSGVTNNGTYYVDSASSTSTAVLTRNRLPSATLDPNNGALTWALYERASLTVSDVRAFQTEIGVWAVDASVDRHNLYYTYGYLIRRFDASSEQYRALIRGIFQLFMLGPTLERFEAAINIVAGLNVIRDDGELLLGYSSQAQQTGTDGTFTFVGNTFTSASAAFTYADARGYIYVTTGVNSGRLFKILSVVDANTLTLSETPTVDSGATWELTYTAEHSVTTTRATYAYPRQIPVRAKYTDPSNWNVLTLRAFEVVTDAFRVTDYVDTPRWWETTRIPQELWEGASGARRQSTPVVFENTLDAPDDPHFDDPGFYFDADSDGVVPDRAILRTGIVDAFPVGDFLYPAQNTNVYIDTVTGAFTAADVGNHLELMTGPYQGEYRILQVVSATRVRVETFLPFPTPATGPYLWQVRAGTLPMRHKAAFVIINKFLKTHMFSVQFDGTLLGLLSTNVLHDLQELVFEAKPSYTYLMLNPATLFQEVVLVQETLETDRSLMLGGDAGMLVEANRNELTFDGLWRFDSWFRNISNTTTYGPTPVLAMPALLGAPPVGYDYYVNRLEIDPATLLDVAGNPLPYAGLVQLISGVPGVGAAVGVDSYGVYITTPLAAFVDAHVLGYVTLTGSGFTNNGTFRIGRVASSTKVYVYHPAPTIETGLAYAVTTTGTMLGRLEPGPTGMAYFTDIEGLHPFSVAHVGDTVRRPYVGPAQQESYVIREIVSPSVVRLATLRTLYPTMGDPDATVVVGPGNTVTANPLELTFAASETQDGRAYATRDRQMYYLVFTSGPNAGTRVLLQTYLTPVSVVVSGAALAADPAATCRLELEEHPEVILEIGAWEHLTPNVTVSGNDGTILTAAQTPALMVSVTSHGVREPQDPTTAVFDVTLGDTYYSIGMQNPRPEGTRSRTPRDVDLRDDPIQIARIP